MKLNIGAKGFELHDAQRYIIDQGIAKLNRYLKHTPQDLINSNVVISCHHTPGPVFTSHLYLELPDQKISSSSTSHKFNMAFKDSLSKLMRQLRKRKTKAVDLKKNPSK